MQEVVKKNMGFQFGTMVLFAVVAAAFIVLFQCRVFGADSMGNISVTGRGVISATPDVAEIYLSIRCEDMDLDATKEKNKQLSDSVVNQLMQMGIKKEDIKTTNYSVRPNYEYNEKGSNKTFIGYTVYNSYSVRTTNINNVALIIDEALKAGATDSDGVSFSLINSNKYYAEALEMAIQNANTTASVIAKEIGVTIGQPSKVVEGYTNDSYATREAYSQSNSAVRGDMASEGGGVSEIFYDKIKVNAQVVMEFSYE